MLYRANKQLQNIGLKISFNYSRNDYERYGERLAICQLWEKEQEEEEVEEDGRTDGVEQEA